MNTLNLNNLTTEGRNDSSKNIDRMSTLDILSLINNEDKLVALAIEKEKDSIALAVDGIVDRLDKGGRLIYIGAGTSGRLGILDASECPPTFGTPPSMVVGVIAGGVEAVFKTQEGAEDSKNGGEDDLKAISLNNLDVVVGLAASGRTPYTIGGLEYAKKVGALTISVVCNKDSVLSKISDIPISPVVGPEVISGSTRLKSGTAQKLVLNMLSTVSMIKLGKVYGNLMVDVVASNEKLIERAKGIVCQATSCSYLTAEQILIKTDFDTKLAIFVILSGFEIEEARSILTSNGRYISKALDSLNPTDV